MNALITVNVWFVVSLCLACILIGGWLFRFYPEHRDLPGDFYEYQPRRQRNTGYQRDYPRY